MLDVVRRQAEAGLDVVTDGEQGKVSFLTYVKERLAGFDQVEGETLLPPSWQKEIDDFPEYYHSYMSKYSSAVAPMRVMVCTGPVSYAGQAALAADVANLRAALADPDVAGRVTRPSCRPPAPAGSAATSTTSPSRITWPRWPKPCGPSTSRSSRPVSCCRWTTRG